MVLNELYGWLIQREINTSTLWEELDINPYTKVKKNITEDFSIDGGIILQAWIINRVLLIIGMR